MRGLHVRSDYKICNPKNDLFVNWLFHIIDAVCTSALVKKIYSRGDLFVCWLKNISEAINSWAGFYKKYFISDAICMSALLKEIYSVAISCAEFSDKFQLDLIFLSN